MPNQPLAVGLITAFVLTLSVARGQELSPPAAPRSSEAPAAAAECSPDSRSNAETQRRFDNPSEKLAQSRGVICPPPGIDLEMTIPPPAGGVIEIIPPPNEGPAPRSK
jgi:hypothetical protein